MVIHRTEKNTSSKDWSHLRGINLRLSGKRKEIMKGSIKNKLSSTVSGYKDEHDNKNNPKKMNENFLNY